MLAFYVALAVAALVLALGVSHKDVGLSLGAASVVFFVVINWWFLQDRRREKRRRAAIRAVRSGESIEPPKLVAKRSAGQRIGRYAMLVGIVLVSFGLPLFVIGASAHSAALKDVGLALIVLHLLVLAVVLPGLSARRRRSVAYRTSDDPQPS